jgi:fibronectin type 3 domain-containing protein
MIKKLFLAVALIAFPFFGCINEEERGETPCSFCGETQAYLKLSAPSGVTANASSSGITISWFSVAGASEYYIYRSASSGGSYVIVGFSTSTSYTNNSGLTAGETYYYKVSASNSSGEGPQSAPAYATAQSAYSALSAPTGLDAEANSANSITISWNPVSGASIYRIYRSDYSYSGYTLIGTSASTLYTSSGLAAGTTYYYKVTAYSNGVESPQSDWISEATPYPAPSAPTGLYAEAYSASSIILEWNYVSSASVYYIYRSEISYGDYAQVGLSASAEYEDYGLAAGTTYYYKVSAVNGSGGESAQSISVSATTLYPAPSTPENARATVNSANSITISWNSVAGASGYRVYRSANIASGYTLVGIISTSTLTSFQNTGLSANTTYYYRVTAYGNGGESPQSDYVLAKTPCAAQPSAPTGLQFSGTALIWDEAPGAEGYRIYLNGSALSTVTQTSITIGSLPGNFSVAAIIGSCESERVDASR